MLARLVIHLVAATRVFQPIGKVGKVARTIVTFKGSHSRVDI